MCIICEMDDMVSIETAGKFLTAFDKSRGEMRQSAELMLECAKSAVADDTRKRYDRTHKRMVKLMREWNQLEEFREHCAPEA